MYIAAHRVRRLTVDGVRVGIDAFLYEHDVRDLPEDMREDCRIVDQIANQNPGKLIAESVELVPGSNAVLSFVDVVGKEGLDKENIKDFLHQKEHDIERHYQEKQESFTNSIKDIAVKFGITYGLRGQEVREYKALAERAVRLFESREPPRWRTEKPWIVIQRKIRENHQRFSLTPGTAERLQQIHGETWISSRVSIDRHTKQNLELMQGELIQHIAPILTGLTLEQIAAQGGLILHDSSIKKKIKWPELTEI